MATVKLNGQLLTLNGEPVWLNGPDPLLRLATATAAPRRGMIRNEPRRGLILNPTRKGTIVELTE